MSKKSSLDQFNVLIEQHQKLFNGAYAEIKPGTIGLCSAYFISGIYRAGTWTNGVDHHDPMLDLIMIEQISDDKFVASLIDGGSLVVMSEGGVGVYPYTIAPEGLHFRKTTGSAEKILKALTKWQEKRLAFVKERKNKIPNYNQSNLKDI